MPALVLALQRPLTSVAPMFDAIQYLNLCGRVVLHSHRTAETRRMRGGSCKENCGSLVLVNALLT